MNSLQEAARAALDGVALDDSPMGYVSVYRGKLQTLRAALAASEASPTDKLTRTLARTGTSAVERLAAMHEATAEASPTREEVVAVLRDCAEALGHAAAAGGLQNTGDFAPSLARQADEARALLARLDGGG